MQNAWADPAGSAPAPPPICYRIKDPYGTVVLRETETAFDTGRQRYYHALRGSDQAFADAIVALIQHACSYFYAPDEAYEPLTGVDAIVIRDDEVRRRIDRLDQGENRREAERTGQVSYPLSALPSEQQRALIEQIEALKQEWGFEILGPVQAAISSEAA